MSRTPGNSDDDPAISTAVDSSGPTMPLADDTADAALDVDSRKVLSEAVEISPDVDSALFARDARAAGDAGEGGRADALICARALLAERQGDDTGALILWRSAFDRDPTLLVAFWGLRRALLRVSDWDELLGVLGRRIAAVFSAERQEARADLWLEHGRVLEDRLGREDEAAHSYRSGLIEVPDHPGLLMSLLSLGWRRADAVMTAEALHGLLRRPLPSALRASLSILLARLDRPDRVNRVNQSSAVGSAQGEPEVQSLPVSIEPVAAARALEALRAALGQVDRPEVGPLLDELALLKQATAEPGIRAEILEELISQLDLSAGGDSDGAMVVALQRERSRLLRDKLDDQGGAEQALYQAHGRSPRHPLVIGDLADLAEAAPGGEANRDDAVARLGALYARVIEGGSALETNAQRELALRHLTALARAGRMSEGLSLLDRHPDLDRERVDVFALEMILRAAAGDVAGLAELFERDGEGLARRKRARPADDGPDDAAAQLLVVAGTLRECLDPSGSAGGGADTEPTRLYRRAVEIAPGYRPARDAVERRLWGAGQHRELADFWESELAQLRAPDEPNGAARARRLRLLEELVAVHRDFLNDRVAAARYQDELLATGSRDTRAWVRRLDLHLAMVTPGEPSATVAKIQMLRELAERAGTVGPKTTLFLEAGRAAAAAGDATVAEEFFTKARANDRSGAASAGLERLVRVGEGSSGRVGAGALGSRGGSRGGRKEGSLEAAEIVRAEMLALGAQTDGRAAENATRLRALRFRIAWHAQNGQQPRQALEVLEPLRAVDDVLAWSWSWEIARQSGDPALEVAILRAVPENSAAVLLRVSADLGGALESTGDLVGAEAAYRDALRREESTDAALGLLRVGSILGNATVILEATSHLMASADPATAPLISQEIAILSLLTGTTTAGSAVSPLPAPNDGGIDASVGVALRWAAGVRSGDILGAAAGLLAIARLIPDTNTTDAAADRNGLLARAAARARFGGTALAGAVHDQVHAVSKGGAAIAIGLSDLPVTGRPERAAARAARAERNGGRLAVALDLERALDAEARGDAVSALDGFARALSRDPEGIEALDGIKRLARATGDRLGAARAGMRLGAILRAPARAAAEFGMAGQLFEDLGMTPEGAVAYWQALSRDPGSNWLYERLRGLLGGRGDDAGLDRLYGHRLSVLDPRARVELLFERAGHRLARLLDRRAAIDDLKRILKIDPHHAGALRQLATLALQMELFSPACGFLNRLLVQEKDEVRKANLRLELGDAYELARDLIRAVETFRAAASARPKDGAPWQRLTDLFLRGGDWPSALAALRHWEAAIGDPVPKAELWVRIGCLLRDQGRDGGGAAAAFVIAADLDPLGEGVHELVALHGRSGAIAARRDALNRAVAGLRRVLTADPIDVPRLRRLRELLQISGSLSGGDRDALDAEGVIVTGQILSLCGEAVHSEPARQRMPRGQFKPDFWSRLGHPDALGFAAEIWPMLAAAAADLFPPVSVRPVQGDRIPHGSEPGLTWVEAASNAVGLPTLELFFLKGSDARNISVIPSDGPAPALIVGAGVLSGHAAVRFRVGRALGLLRDRAVVMERTTAADLQTLFAAAAVIAGAPALRAPDAASDLEEQVKLLGKAMSRKDRRALELEASRFGFESIDSARFRDAILENADRLGLVLAGDVNVAVQAVGRLDTLAPPATIVMDDRALDLIRFALHDDYLALRRGIDEGEG